MDSYLIRLKVLPTGPEVDSQKLLDSLKVNLFQGVVIRDSKVEEIAFGLYALMIDVVAPASDGIVDSVEKSVSSAPLVAHYETLGVSRLSSRLHV
jgi:translation elongation factor aEF-1 beta